MYKPWSNKKTKAKAAATPKLAAIVDMELTALDDNDANKIEKQTVTHLAIVMGAKAHM